MHTIRTFHRPIPLFRPAPLRWLEAAADTLHAAWARVLHARRQRAEQRRAVWDLDTASSLSDSTLRDIGAPDWLRVEAAVRRGADHVSVVEWRMGSSGLFDRSTY